MSNRRVVVTGAGCVTSIGRSLSDFRDAIFHAVTGMSEVELLQGQKLNFTKVARVVDFDPSQSLSSSTCAATDRGAQFALVAAAEAVGSAGFPGQHELFRTGVMTGCSAGGRAADEAEVVNLYGHGGRVHPLTVPRVMASSGASQISMHYGITGPALNFSTACAASAHAIGHAFHMIRSGTLTACIAGGHEAALTYGFLKAWEALRVVSPQGCRPFSSDRDGMTLGEGAAMLVLEDLQYAQHRGAPILAEIVGFGMSSDASHLTQPRAEGAAMAMRNAIEDAGLAPEQIDYINAHGTGTQLNDTTEAEAIRFVFQHHTEHVWVSSTKGLHGHCIGAAGALEALATVLGLHHGRLPTNTPALKPDGNLGLRMVEDAKQAAPGIALSNSFAFGGLNSALVFRRWQGE